MEELRARLLAETERRERYAAHAQSEDTRREAAHWVKLARWALDANDKNAIRALLEPAIEPLGEG